MTNDPPPLYEPTARVAPLAGAALVCGLLAFCLTFVAGIPAIILGVWAVKQISREPHRRAGKGLAIAGIATGVVGSLLGALVILLVPTILRARDHAMGSRCAGNVCGITKAMAVYANENNNVFPLTAYTGTTYRTDASSSGVAGGVADVIHNTYYASATDNRPFDCLWILVLQGSVGTKSLICGDDPKSIYDYSGRRFASESSGATWYTSPQIDGSTDGACSYSIAFPWATGPTPGPAPYWHNNQEAEVPLVSDMALAGSDLSKSGKYLNSYNHGGDGQNVGFGDCHAELTRTPRVGQGGESIFHSGGTVGSETSQAVPIVNPPTSGGYTGWDILMVPMRDKDGRLR